MIYHAETWFNPLQYTLSNSQNLVMCNWNPKLHLKCLLHTCQPSWTWTKIIVQIFAAGPWKLSWQINWQWTWTAWVISLERLSNKSREKYNWHWPLRVAMAFELHHITLGLTGFHTGSVCTVLGSSVCNAYRYSLSRYISQILDFPCKIFLLILKDTSSISVNW